MVSRKYGSSPSTEHGNEHAWIVKHSMFSTVGSTQQYPVSTHQSALSTVGSQHSEFNIQQFANIQASTERQAVSREAMLSRGAAQ